MGESAMMLMALMIVLVPDKCNLQKRKELL